MVMPSNTAIDSLEKRITAQKNWACKMTKR